jgi:hypothetical protein
MSAEEQAAVFNRGVKGNIFGNEIGAAAVPARPVGRFGRVRRKPLRRAHRIAGLPLPDVD